MAWPLYYLARTITQGRWKDPRQWGELQIYLHMKRNLCLMQLASHCWIELNVLPYYPFGKNDTNVLI